MRNAELKEAKNSVKRIYITLKGGEPNIDIINYAKRVRKKQKRKQYTDHHKTICKRRVEICRQ